MRSKRSAIISRMEKNVQILEGLPLYFLIMCIGTE